LELGVDSATHEERGKGGVEMAEEIKGKKEEIENEKGKSKRICTRQEEKKKKRKEKGEKGCHPGKKKREKKSEDKGKKSRVGFGSDKKRVLSGREENSTGIFSGLIACLSESHFNLIIYL
jgi:hypothetical protein